MSLGGDLPDCITDCNTAIELDKKNVKAFLRRAMAREQLEKFKQAAVDFSEVLQLDPGMDMAVQGFHRVVKVRTLPPL